MRETFPKTKPVLLEPIMKIEIECPSQFQGTVVGNLTGRRGMVVATELDGVTARIEGEVPLAETFGYSTDLRSMTQGQGTFTMEFARYRRVPREHRAGGDRAAEGRRHGRGLLRAEGGGRQLLQLFVPSPGTDRRLAAGGAWVSALAKHTSKARPHPNPLPEGEETLHPRVAEV